MHILHQNSLHILHQRHQNILIKFSFHKVNVKVSVQRKKDEHDWICTLKITETSSLILYYLLYYITASLSVFKLKSQSPPSQDLENSS